MKLGYRYCLGTNGDTLWRFNPEGACEISLNKPDNWTFANSAEENMLEAFQDCDKLTKREAKRFFPLATIL